MITKAMIVKNKVGLHARPAAMLVKVASKYNSDISITYNDKTVDCKSILSLMTLRVRQGESVSISVNGSDEELAMSDIIDLFERNFDEE